VSSATANSAIDLAIVPDNVIVAAASRSRPTDRLDGENVRSFSICDDMVAPPGEFAPADEDDIGIRCFRCMSAEVESASAQRRNRDQVAWCDAHDRPARIYAG
jgi:hypothetical protein